jgi:hypothetical protein
MSLTFKKASRDDLRKVSVYIEDNTPTSPNYFRMSNVPELLTKGKNLIRISAHPTNLVDNSPVLIDVRDSNGNPIYYEIPDYIEEDKSRVISIWIYHDKGDDNTPNGIATITILGTSKFGSNGEPIPSRFAGKPNVKWQTTVNVDRNRKSNTNIIFDPLLLPTLIVSESLGLYEYIPTTGTALTATAVSSTNANYIYKGTTAIIQFNGGVYNNKLQVNLNNEMIGATLVFSSYGTQLPIATKPNPLTSVYYVTTIKEIINSTTVIVESPFTTKFLNLTDETHTYTSAHSTSTSILYFSTGSNSTTNSQQSFANLTLSSIEPISGVVDKIKILMKTSGLNSDYELLSTNEVPFSSSISLKLAVPTEYETIPRSFKIQYLNAVGDISKTETTSNPYVFQGVATKVLYGNILLSGSIITSDGTPLSSTSPGTVSSSAQTIAHLIGADLTVASITAEQYVISSSVTYMTTSFSSGSTIFGNSVDDTHTFTGDITASGNISASGDVIATNINASGGLSSSGLFVNGLQNFIGSATENESTSYTQLAVGGTQGANIKLYSQHGASTRDVGLHMSASSNGQEYSIGLARARNTFYISPSDVSVGPESSVFEIDTVGNITASGDISSSGTITANAFVGGGSGITGVVSASYALTASHALNAGAPGGSDTQVQFNDGGSFGGDVGFTYNKTTDSLTILGNLESDNFSTNGLTRVGDGAGFHNTGAEVTVMGLNAGYDNTEDNLVAIGYEAGLTNSGGDVTVIGAGAGYENRGNNLVAIGQSAGDNNTLNNQFIVQHTAANAIPLIQGNFESGSIGIGLTLPQSNLHVAGDIWASGSNGHITASGDISSSGTITGTTGSFNYIIGTVANVIWTVDFTDGELNTTLYAPYNLAINSIDNVYNSPTSSISSSGSPYTLGNAITTGEYNRHNS